MPLLDHFAKHFPRRFRWEGFHSLWTGTIVRQLNHTLLPARYHAEPRVRLGTLLEVDVGTMDERSDPASELLPGAEGGLAVYSPPQPALSFEADLSQEDVFEVLLFDDELGGELVAAIELISPRNKDRPQSRHDFVVKCASMLKTGVSLVLIDIVTVRQSNLFEGILDYLEIRVPENPLKNQLLYACSLQPHGVNGHARVEVWPAVLQVGGVLPILPLWLREDLAVPLELEKTYEETRSDLRG